MKQELLMMCIRVAVLVGVFGISFVASTVTYALTPSEIRDLKQRAESGEIRAQMLLGYIYREDVWGVEKDERHSANWYCMAAYRGGLDAQIVTGANYYLNFGHEQNLQQAYFWYLLAYERGAENIKILVDNLHGKLRPDQRTEVGSADRDWKPSAINSGTCPLQQFVAVPPAPATPPSSRSAKLRSPQKSDNKER